jgi:uncharacterized protein YdeI (YjbR/CyaY-like superfamily)
MGGNPMSLSPDLPVVNVATRAQWRAWLERNHRQPTGVWAATVRKADLAAGEDFVSARDLNEECLCFGWIDSKPARISDRRTGLLCTPRRAGGGWSKVNKDRIELLRANRQMTPAGEEAITIAIGDGSWTKLDAVDALEVPADLSAALGTYANAQRHFDAFPPSTRKGILEWIAQAKTDATRAKRVAKTAELAEQNQRANQWQGPR